MNNRHKIWKNKPQREIVEDCLEAMSVAISLIHKELSTNNSIKNNPRQNKIYKHHAEVLLKIKNKFYFAKMMGKKPKGTTVKKRIIT